MHSNRGRHVSRSADSPPIQNTSLPSAASVLDPVTGTPRKRTLWACASAAIFLENDGLTVLQSIHNWPGVNRERNPSLPRAASSTASGWASIVNITSTCDATAAGEPAHVAPPATKDSAFSRVRLKTTREWPHFCRFAAIRLPIIPKPMKPIFISTSVAFLSCEFGNSFNLFEVRLNKANCRRTYHVIHLLRLACANDRSGDGRVAQSPGHSDCA